METTQTPKTISIADIIKAGPGSNCRVIGWATLKGVHVPLLVSVNDTGSAIVEWTEDNGNTWIAMGGNYSLAMPFEKFLSVIPMVAQLTILPSVTADMAEVMA